jgi:hypothetical protein
MKFRVQQFRKVLFLVGLVMLIGFAGATPSNVFNVTTFSSNPSSVMLSGTPVAVSLSVNITEFPAGGELDFITDLQNPRWNWTLLLDGVENPRPSSGGQTLALSGFELSYPPKVLESLNVTLEGTAPPMSSPSSQTIINITEIDSSGNPVTETQFSRKTTVYPSGAWYSVAPNIEQGATIYIGEQDLNLTHALNRAGGLSGPALDSQVPTNMTIGWWASAADIAYSTSSKTLDISFRYRDFTVTKDDFVGYAGYWYLEDPSRPRYALIGPDGLPKMAFYVSDPTLDIQIWDFDQAAGVNGRSATWGDAIGFRIDTNMYGALNSLYRSPVSNDNNDGYINLKVRNESGFTYTALYDSTNTPRDLLRQNVSTSSWTWGDPANPASSHPWATGVTGSGGQPIYFAGTYTVGAESMLNNMKNNYKSGGADYTGKTVSQSYTVTLVPEALNIESNKDSIVRGGRFSVTITGKPNTAYYLWVNHTGTMTGTPRDQPPTILVSAPVYQDPYEGPYVIGTHTIPGSGGKTILDDVPPSTVNVSRNEYYAKVVTSSTGTATVEFRTSPDTKPGTYSLRAEKDSFSDEVSLTVESTILPVAGNPGSVDKVINHPLINPDIPAAVNNDLKRIAREGTIFIGEEGLNVTEVIASADALAVPALSSQGTLVGWWASSADISTTSPSKTVDLAGREASLQVAPADFVGYSGNWYLINPSTGNAARQSNGNAILVFTVADPTLNIKIWDLDINADMTGKSVPQGERLTFRVDTNMYTALDPVSRPDITGSTMGTINIIVKNENNARLNYLYQNNTTANTLLNQKISFQPFFWGGGAYPQYWATDLLDRDGYPFYPVGTYTVGAESTLNNMKNNYKTGGAEYTGKTVSQSYTITLVSDRVWIEANKDAVTRGKPFSVTISGRPARLYYLWVKNTSSLTGGSNNQPPMISLSQAGVYLDSASGSSFPIGSYQYENGGLKTIKMDVGTDPVYNGTRYYGKIVTDTSGVRTVQFETNSLTRNMTYTIRVENLTGGLFKSDEINVTVLNASDTKVAVFRNGSWYLDYNGDGLFITGVDKNYGFGAPGWTPVIGNWNGTGPQKIGVYKDGNWYLDYNGDGVFTTGVDKNYGFGAAGWTPLIGDWNGDGSQKIGVFKDGNWYLDYNGDGLYTTGDDKVFGFGAPGWLPVVGKW